MDHPDSRYLEALLNNNQALLKELYHKCFGKIRNFVVNNHGTDDDAWDILQEGMLALFYRVKKQTFELTCPLDAFIYIICRNLWIKELRKKQTGRVTITEDRVYLLKGEDHLALAEECSIQYARRKLFADKLDELGEGCKKLLIQNWHGLNLEKVAHLMNISYAYARKRKSECMAKLVMLMKNSSEYEQLKW